MSTTTTTTTVVLTCVVFLACVGHGLRPRTVVIIPFPYVSHTKYHTNVARVLAQKGHSVWVTIPTYLLRKGVLDTSGFQVLPYEAIPNLDESTQDVLSKSYFEGRQDKFWAFLHICRRISDTLLRNETFIAAIEQKYPHLIVIDNLPMFYAMSVIPYKLGVPFAFLGSVYYPPVTRIPYSAADVPLHLFPYSNRMTFFQRLHNTLYYMLFAVYDPSSPEDVVSVYAPEMVYMPLSALARKAEIFIVELDHVLDYPKPTLPNVKLIGGTATGPAKALAPEFKSFMDCAKEGVVIVSFGSYVLHVPKHISDKILQVLLQLPMKAVFRSNLTSPDPKKILTAPWIPQNDLLGHPHTKVFVSHCGKNGQYEALYHAVPTVATPLFIDQTYNAERVRVKGFAEVLDLNTVTAEELKAAILKVAREPRYKKAVVKYSRLFKELYGVPMETAAYWLEHVMEFGGDYMRSAGQQMPFYQYALLDVFAFIFCVLAVLICLFFVLIKIVLKLICRYVEKKKDKAE